MQPFRIGWETQKGYTPDFANPKFCVSIFAKIVLEPKDCAKIILDTNAVGKIVMDHAVDYLTKAIPKVWRPSNPEKLMMQPDCNTRMDWGHLTDFQGEGKAICKTSNPSTKEVFGTNCGKIKTGIPSRLLASRQYCDGKDPNQITFQLKSSTFRTLTGRNITPKITKVRVCDRSNQISCEVITETVSSLVTSSISDLHNCQGGSKTGTTDTCKTFTNIQYELPVVLPFTGDRDLIIEYRDGIVKSQITNLFISCNQGDGDFTDLDIL